MKKILIVVDMQNDFITGSLGNKDCRNAVKGCVDLCRTGGFNKLFFTLDTHQTNYMETLEGQKLPVEHCIEGTTGWGICPELYPYIKDACLIEKSTFGSVPNQTDNLPGSVIEWAHKNLRGTEDYIEPIELHFCGVCTSVCVLSNMTILRAYFPNTKIVLHRNATGDVTEEMKQAAFICAKAIQCEVED